MDQYSLCGMNFINPQDFSIQNQEFTIRNLKLSNIYKFTKLKINEIKTLFDYFDSIYLLDKSNNLFNLFNSYFAINKIFMIILFLLSLVYYVVKRSSGVSEEFINLCIPQMCTT